MQFKTLLNIVNKQKTFTVPLCITYLHTAIVNKLKMQKK